MKIIFLSILCFTTFFAIGQSENAQSSPNTTLVAGIQDLCWSPDGKTIYFSGLWHKHDYSDFKPENWNIYRYDLLNKTTTIFIDSAYYVAVSPSGKQIATGKIRDGNRDIYIYDSDGKNHRRITTHPKTDYAPSFSPDGKKILFNSMRNGKSDIYVVNSDSTGLKRLTFSSNDSSYHSPQCSPNGKEIVFYLSTGNRADQIFTMSADGSNARNITSDSFLNFYPAWVNQRKVIYTQESNGKNRTFTISTNGKNKKLLFESESFFARISPSGKMIAYIDTKEQCIKVVSIKGKLISKILLVK